MGRGSGAYREIHLNSDDSTKSKGSTRNRPLWEFQDSLDVSKFTVRSVEAPYSWLVLSTAQSFDVDLDFKFDDGHDEEIVNLVYKATIPKQGANIDWDDMLEILEAAFNTMVPTSSNQPLIKYDATTIEVEESQSSEGKIKITFPPDTFLTLVSGKLTWTTTQLQQIFNHDSFDPVLTWRGNTVITSNQIELRPSIVFLHSSLMQNTRYGSGTINNDGSRTGSILAKIPIKDLAEYGTYVSWENTADFTRMFTCTTPIDRAEFWFTDAHQKEIDFGGYGFSLTLSLIE